MEHPRQPAYDAVFEVVRRTPSTVTENARVWRAVAAALDAMDVPNVAASDLYPMTSPRSRTAAMHVEGCTCLESDGAVLNVDERCHIQ